MTKDNLEEKKIEEKEITEKYEERKNISRILKTNYIIVIELLIIILLMCLKNCGGIELNIGDNKNNPIPQETNLIDTNQKAHNNNELTIPVYPSEWYLSKEAEGVEFTNPKQNTDDLIYEVIQNGKTIYKSNPIAPNSSEVANLYEKIPSKGTYDVILKIYSQYTDAKGEVVTSDGSVADIAITIL